MAVRVWPQRSKPSIPGRVASAGGYTRCATCAAAYGAAIRGRSNAMPSASIWPTTRRRRAALSSAFAFTGKRAIRDWCGGWSAICPNCSPFSISRSPCGASCERPMPSSAASWRSGGAPGPWWCSSMWPAWSESSMRFFRDSISSGKTAPSPFLHKQLDVTRLMQEEAVCIRPRYNANMRYLVRGRVKPGRETDLLEAIERCTLGRGSVAEAEYLRNMKDARLFEDQTSRCVGGCDCPIPLLEERPYRGQYFDRPRDHDAHAPRR